jgi:hypothetical protein
MRTALLVLAVMLGGCTPQQTAGMMPLLSYGTAMSSQAANLYMQQERLQMQQAQMQTVQHPSQP